VTALLTASRHPGSLLTEPDLTEAEFEHLVRGVR
jgi:hypothetical protein